MNNKVKEIESINVIIGPHMTEKSYSGDDNVEQYVFKVMPTATKTQIKVAIENLFKVQVDNINTINVKGKTKSFKQKVGRRKSWKKAYIKLKEGFELDFVGAVDKG